MKKRILSILLVLAMLLPLFQQIAPIASAATYSGTCGDNVNWSLDTGTGTLTISGTGKMSSYSDVPAPWRSYFEKIISVKICDGVTNIGDSAFYICRSLTSVTIPNSVTTIGEYAFRDCVSLTSVALPNSITTIGHGAFLYCEGLTGVTIPNRVTIIGNSAFRGCKSLTSVTIPNSVTTIDNYAFLDCVNLTSITIPNSVTTISIDAFGGCKSLTNVTIPNSVTTIDSGAFSGCENLECITILNPTCSILTYQDGLTLGSPDQTVIYGYKGSTAQAHAKKYNYNFVSLDGSVEHLFDGGRGTKNDPYLLSTAEGLDAVRQYPNAHFRQTKDIDLSQWGNWTPIEYFNGNYDGGLYKIKGLTIHDKQSPSYQDSQGLFKEADKKAVFRRMILTDANILIDRSRINYYSLGLQGNNSTLYAGTICGYGWYSSYEDCTVSGTLQVIGCADAYVGGIVGYEAENILRCTSSVNVTVSATQMYVNWKYGQAFCGGIYGGDLSTSGTVIEGCSNFGIVNGSSHSNAQVGGIAGASQIDIRDCVNYGDIYCNAGDYYYNGGGGIVGSTMSWVDRCVNYGNIYGSHKDDSGSLSLGGITGCWKSGHVKDCYNLGAAVKGDASLGRVIGTYQAGGNSLNPTYPDGNYSIDSTTINGEVLLPSDISSDSAICRHGNSLSAEDVLMEETYSAFDFNSMWTLSPLWNGPILAETPWGDVLPTPTPKPIFHENKYIADIWLSRRRDCATTTETKAITDYLSSENLSTFIVTELQSNKKFQKHVDEWDGFKAVFNTAEYKVDEIFEEEDLYEGLIMDLIKMTMENREQHLSNALLDSAMAVEKTGEVVSEAFSTWETLVDAMNTTSEGLLGMLKFSVPNPQESIYAPFYNALNNIDNGGKSVKKWTDADFLQGLSELANYAEDIGTFLKLFKSYVSVYDLSDEMVTLLTEMKKHTTNNAFRNALSKVIESVGNFDYAKAICSCKVTADLATTVFENAFDGFAKAVPVYGAFKVGYDAGVLVTNILFNTEDTLDSYKLIEATHTFITTSKSAIRALEEKYIQSESELDAAAYVNAVQTFLHVYEIDLNSALNFLKNSTDKGLVNWTKNTLASGLHHLLGVEYNTTYEAAVEAKEHIMEVLTLRFDALNNSWKYRADYLQADYPDIYPLYVSNDFSKDVFTPAILSLWLNEKGETEIKWQINNTYTDSDGLVHWLYGSKLINGTEIKENINGIVHQADFSLEAGIHTATMYDASNFSIFPKEYSLRSYADIASERIYTKAAESILEFPCKPVEIKYNKIGEHTTLLIQDSSSAHYDNIVYHIYRKEEGGTFQEVSKIHRQFSYGGQYTYLTDDSAREGTAYIYKVVSELSFENGKSLTVDGKNTIGIVFRSIPTASKLMIETFPIRHSAGRQVASDFQVCLSWEVQEGAGGYEVYRREAYATFSTCLGQVTETTYVDTTAREDTDYEYYVIPYSMSGDDRIYADSYSSGELLASAGEGEEEEEEPKPSGDPIRYAVEGGYLTFDPTTGTIIDCDETVTSAVIPAKIQGVSVTAIGEDAFFNCKILTKVSIPNGVTTIEDFAFCQCERLANITIPNSVTTVGEYSFYRCESFTSITIPDSVTTIGDYAFYYCHNVTEVSISNSVTTIGGSAFKSCDSLTEVMVPAGVTTIGDSAFSECDSLTEIRVDPKNSFYSSDAHGILFNKNKSVLVQCPGAYSGAYIIPDSVKAIGNDAFSWCRGLASITIPNSVTTIGDYAFYCCDNLTDIRIPAGVATIGEAAFSSCDNLNGIWVDSGNRYYCSDTQGILFNKDKSTLIQCPGAYSGAYIIPDSVKSIGNNAFYRCRGLTSIAIPDSVTTIGNDAFYACDSLVDVIIPNSVTDIGESAFSSCDSLKTLTLPEGITDIKSYTFAYCGGLTEITIPVGVTLIDRFAFDSCISLTDVYYTGSKQQWNNIEIDDFGNDPLLSATMHYNYHPESTEPEPVENPFSDVNEKDYYFTPVLWAVEKGITTGTGKGKFSPNDACTRGQIVTFLWRAAGSPKPKTANNPFSDVSKKAYYYDAVLWAVEQGITNGTGKGKFSPDDTCTRGQIVTFLWRAQGEPAPTSSTNPFNDVKSGTYYYHAVLWAVEKSITNGMGKGKFSPEDNCTRGQIVTFLYRALN